MPSTKPPTGSAPSPFNQKLKSFFRIQGAARDAARDKTTPNDAVNSGHSSPSPQSGNTGGGKPDFKSIRNTSFFKTTVGRLRSTTTVSEGNPLDETLSPTAHANPYFAHQGQPGLRHHNDGSVPPSPPDTLGLIVKPGSASNSGDPNQQPTNATREELARKLRRVASAPNAQGLFSKGKSASERPATAELGKDPLVVDNSSGTLELVDGSGAGASSTDGTVGAASSTASASQARHDQDILTTLPPPAPNSLAFRRTYSSNSIKVRDVEVGPESFDKIKLIGKGDVGKVYLVREKKSARLYAMKGAFVN